MGNIVANALIPEVRRPKCRHANIPEYQILVSPDSSSLPSSNTEVFLFENFRSAILPEGNPKKKLKINPGTLDDLDRECRNVQAVTFEGAKIFLINNRMKNLKLTHSLYLGDDAANGYVLKATYTGTQKNKETNAEEASPIIEAEFDPLGMFSVNITNRFNSRLSCKIATEIVGPTSPMLKFNCDYFGDDYTASMLVRTPEKHFSNMNVLGQYLRTITPNLKLGVELSCQLDWHISRIENLLPILCGRLNIGRSIFSGNISNAGMQFCFYRPLSPFVSICFEYQRDYFANVSLALLGYRVDLPQTHVTFKASIDSQFSVAGVLEKRIPSSPYTFVFSSRLNHLERTLLLGFAVAID